MYGEVIHLGLSKGIRHLLPCCCVTNDLKTEQIKTAHTYYFS